MELACPSEKFVALYETISCNYCDFTIKIPPPWKRQTSYQIQLRPSVASPPPSPDPSLRFLCEAWRAANTTKKMIYRLSYWPWALFSPRPVSYHILHITYIKCVNIKKPRSFSHVLLHDRNCFDRSRLLSISVSLSLLSPRHSLISRSSFYS